MSSTALALSKPCEAGATGAVMPVDIAAAKAIAAAAQAAGGSATIFRAASADETSNWPIFDPQSASLKAVHAQLKRAFDPHGIFNPGRTGL